MVIRQSWQLTLLILLALPIVMYFGWRFEKSVEDYTDVIMQEHKEADSVSEETFRNCKTVASLGAESKFSSLYNRIVGVDYESHL